MTMKAGLGVSLMPISGRGPGRLGVTGVSCSILNARKVIVLYHMPVQIDAKGSFGKLPLVELVKDVE